MSNAENLIIFFFPLCCISVAFVQAILSGGKRELVVVHVYLIEVASLVAKHKL